MNAVRAVQSVVYLLSALVLLCFTLGPLMWLAWGPPGGLPQYVIALCGAFGLAFSAIVSLSAPVAGRHAAIVSLAALGVLWVPGVVYLVPRHGINLFWGYSVLFAAYLAAVGFALLYPVRWRWSVPVFALVLAGAMVPSAIVALQRYQSGEYSWPSFAYFRWYPDPDSLLVVNDRKGRIDPKTKAQLERLGIRGRLDLMGGIRGGSTATHRVIVLAQRPPTESYALHIPRAGLLVYAFDGSQWRRIPEGAATYPSFAVLEPNGLTTMHCETHGVGRSCSLALTW